MAPITLYFLQASRCIRTAWQLEELNLDYDVKFSPRENKVAPPSFKEASGDSLGKFPLLQDGDLSIGESGAIAEYLCEKYDTTHRLLPVDQPRRAQALRWVHAAEGTFMLHALGILYTRWFGEGHSEAQAAIEGGMAGNVQKDLDWLERELNASKGKFLLGDEVTVADCMVLFSVQFIVARELGTKGKKWERIERWVKDCEGTDGYRRAVKKTGHEL